MLFDIQGTVAVSSELLQYKHFIELLTDLSMATKKNFGQVLHSAFEIKTPVAQSVEHICTAEPVP